MKHILMASAFVAFAFGCIYIQHKTDALNEKAMEIIHTTDSINSCLSETNRLLENENNCLKYDLNAQIKFIDSSLNTTCKK